MKSTKDKKLLIDQLRKTPIIQIACEKINVGRTSFYRWRKEDSEFNKAVDQAINEGNELINDLSESQLINLIREKKMPAIALWLKTHHPKYTDKLQISGLTNQDESLSPEQEKLLREALALVSSSEDKTSSNQNDSVSKPGDGK